jgi:plastocyanin
VFSYATKVLTALTGMALVGAAVFYAFVGERSGAILMLFLAVSGLLVIITVEASGVRDIAPYVPGDAPAPQRHAVTPGEAAKGSIWPLLAAASVAVLAVGAATTEAVVYAGIIAVVLSSLGWFGRAWADHATWTPPVRERISDRFVAPLGLPLLGFALTAIIAISLSRVLLATSLEVAPWIALGVAVAILFGCAWVASRPRVASSALMALAALAGVSVLGAGIAGATQGERQFHPHHGDEPIEVVAKDTQFEEKELTAPAESLVTMKFKNLDKDVFHNVAIYTSPEPDAAPIYNGAGFPGIQTKTYKFKTPAPGTYAFRCDFHVNMVGTFVVGGS